MPSLSTPPSQTLAFSPTAAASATSSRFTPTKTKRTFYPHRLSDPARLCRCSSSSSGGNSSSDDSHPRWDAAIQDVLKSAIKRFDSVLSWYTATQDNDAEDNDVVSEKQGEEGDWDWERWKKHFEQIDEQDRLLSVLKVPTLLHNTFVDDDND